MAEYCEGCLTDLEGLTPAQARKETRAYRPGEKDICEGCGRLVVMRKKTHTTGPYKPLKKSRKGSIPREMADIDEKGGKK